MGLTDGATRERPRSRRRTSVRLAGVALVAGGLLALSGCSSQLQGEVSRLGMPEGASDRAPHILDLWIGTWIAAFAIGFFVLGLILFAALRWQRQGNRLPRQNRYNLPMEIMYTLVPFVILGVLFFYTVTAQSAVLKPEPNPQHTVDVVGQKWAWTFNYLEKENPDVGNNVWAAGTLANNPPLVLPVNETVRFNLSSPDVAHSFWIPAFNFKMDVIPGRNNHFDLTPTKVGDYVGRCAELCGTYHSAMVFPVKVVTAEEYAEYCKGLADQGNIGINKGASNTTTIERGGIGDEEQPEGSAAGESDTEGTR